MDMYKNATKISLRFQSDKGSLTIEDLWDIPIEYLDTIAIKLKEELEEKEQKSYLKKSRTKVSIIKELQLKILVDIIETKQEEQEQSENLISKNFKKKKLLAILAQKQDEDLHKLNPEELQKKLDELDEDISSTTNS